MSNPTRHADILYKPATGLSPYEHERCRLDLYLPTNSKSFPTVLWFHGGGLTGGQKDTPEEVTIGTLLAENGIAFASANYRLSPRAKYPDYLHDAAHAFLWLKQNIAAHHGDPGSIFVSGHSAGAYLAAMLVMAPNTLAHVGLSPNDIKGACPVSGQVFTHITIRAERNVPNPFTTPVIDTDAPAYHIRPNTPPMLYLIGDNDWQGRYEETLYFVTMLRIVGNKVTQLVKVDNRDHGSIIGKMTSTQDPGLAALIQFINTHR